MLPILKFKNLKNVHPRTRSGVNEVPILPSIIFEMRCSISLGKGLRVPFRTYIMASCIHTKHSNMANESLWCPSLGTYANAIHFTIGWCKRQITLYERYAPRCLLMRSQFSITPDSRAHGANIGPIWGRQDPGGPYVGPINFAIWDCSLEGGALFFLAKYASVM